MAQNKKGESVVLTFNLITQFFVETFVGMAVGYFLGRWIDGLLFGEGKDIFIYVLMLLGMLSGLVNLIRRVMKQIGREEASDEKKD